MLGKFSEGKSQVTLNLIASESHEALPRIDGMQDSWLKFNNGVHRFSSKQRKACLPALLIRHGMVFFSYVMERSKSNTVKGITCEKWGGDALFVAKRAFQGRVWATGRGPQLISVASVCIRVRGGVVTS